MTLEELNKKATEIAKWLSPDQVLNNIIDYLSNTEDFLNKEIERRFNYYRANPQYENLTDQCLMDMARADVEAERQGYGQVYLLVSSIVNVICDLIERISYYLGRADIAKEIGTQQANVEAGVSLPDVSTIAAGLFRNIFTSGEAGNFMQRLGYPPDLGDKILKTFESILDVSTITTLWHRGKLKTEDAVKELKARGYTEARAHNILTASLSLLSPDMIRNLYLRKEIDEATHDKLLQAHGLTDEQIGYIKKLYEIIPPVSDIITMAVREAFTPEIAERFGQYQDFPEEFAEWAEKQGLSREWALRYWAAHWSLPSVTQGYEMLHRGVITEDELRMLMRAQDIMPFWRDKLIQISYSPFTRVDVRRMYKEGVIDREDVKRTYLDLGYDDWHAEKLTEWTIKEALSEDRKLTRSLIEGLYKRGIFTESEAKDALIAIGYRPEIAEIIVTKAQYDLEYKYKDRIIAAVRKQYLKGLISENDAVATLSRINMLSTEIEQLIYEWRLEKQAQVETLSAGELKELARKKVIGHDMFIDKMTQIGYTKNDAELLWQATQK